MCKSWGIFNNNYKSCQVEFWMSVVNVKQSDVTKGRRGSKVDLIKRKVRILIKHHGNYVQTSIV